VRRKKLPINRQTLISKENKNFTENNKKKGEPHFRTIRGEEGRLAPFLRKKKAGKEGNPAEVHAGFSLFN